MSEPTPRDLVEARELVECWYAAIERPEVSEGLQALHRLVA